MTNTFTAVVHKEGGLYVAECLFSRHFQSLTYLFHGEKL